MNDKRTGWDERWREKTEHPFEPDPWLLKVLPLLPAAGRALDIASGRGRNALLLAERGLSVTALDISEEALAQLGREAALRRLQLETRRVDLEDNPELPAAAFDLVIDFFYLHRPLLPQLRNAVRPGGVAVLRTLSCAGSFPGGPENPAFVLQPGELLDIFAGWEVLLHEEGVEPSRKGGSVAGIVARRPAILTALGMCSGISVHTVAAAFSISAVFYSSVVAFNAVKYAGGDWLHTHPQEGAELAAAIPTGA